MNEARLQQLLDGFPQARIAVIGDFFLDKLLLVDRALDEPSLETGLAAYQVTGKRISPGAAGTVMNNLAALTVGELYTIGFRGDDGDGWELEHGLLAQGINTDWLIKSPGLFTPTYMKPMFSTTAGYRETNRLDIRNRGTLPADVEDRIIENLHAAAHRVDAVIALDQVMERNTGVITDRVRSALAELGNTHRDLIVYADSRAHTMDFRNVIVKCNHLEAVRAVHSGFSGEPEEGLVRQCVLAMANAMGRPVFVTCGAKGIFTVAGNDVKQVQAIPVEGEVDICGAGDAATAGIVGALCCGATPAEAALVANLAASITIQQIGTTGTATREQLLARYREQF